MITLEESTLQSTIDALCSALRIIEKKSAQVAEAGACMWQCPDGSVIYFKMTPEDCALIKGAIYIGGTCEEAKSTVKMNSSGKGIR
jgi:hypothetical protein